MKHRILQNTLLLFVCLFLACNSEPLPQEPDYKLSDAWYTNTSNEDVDVFYILPTCVFNWTDNKGVTYQYGDIYNEKHRNAQLYSYKLAEEIFGENTNFYAPYYRQLTLNVWINGEEAVERLFPTAMGDIYAAFDNFINTKNNNRPFIIAGFSQGGKCVVELVKKLSEEEQARMIAAYVIGYKITSNDLKNKNISKAKRADDIGVTICYNSVETIEAINPMISESELCINPANWRTDQTPATISGDTTVTLNNTHKILIVDGLDSKALYSPDLKELFKQGNYHLQELELYKNCLIDNVATRIKAYKSL